ncbi:MAG: tetratricopeptide repeat protein [Myxococcales bacterium]
MSLIVTAEDSHTESLVLGLSTLLFLLALQLALSGLTRAQEPATQAPASAGVAAEATSAGSSAGPGAAEADAPGSVYSRAIDAALMEYERGNFEEAREHLRAAHEAYPNARTYRGLGKAEFELRNYGESVKMLEAALTSQVKPLDATLRAEVEAILARARAYVGEVHVNVEPGTATVSVDGVLMASGPDAALALVVGDHVLEFRASGHLPERRAIRVKGGESMTVRVVLPSPNDSGDGHQTIVALQPQASPLVDTATRKRRWVWASVGTLLVGGIVTGAVLAARSGHRGNGDVSGGTTGVVIENP